MNGLSQFNAKKGKNGKGKKSNREHGKDGKTKDDGRTFGKDTSYHNGGKGQAMGFVE